MNFLLDTNVVSEWTKPQPDPNLATWPAGVDEDRTFLSIATFAEIRRGIERLPKSRRRDRLAAWLADDLPARLEDRVLAIDRRVAEAWGVVMARGENGGGSIGTMDGCVPRGHRGSAEPHLVTRNVKDFGTLGIELLDPWNPHV